MTPEAASELFVLGALLVPGGLVVLALALRDLWKAPALPVSGLGALAEGPAMVVGKVASGGTLRDPIRGEPCAFYEVSVLEVGTGKYKVMRTLHKERSSEPFTIADATGSAAVVPDGALLEVPPELNAVQRDPIVPMIERGFSPEVKAYLQRIGKPPAEGFFAPFKLGPGNYHVRAVVLRPGQDLCALGTAERAGTAWRLVKAPRRPLLLCADAGAPGRLRARAYLFGSVGLAMSLFGALLALRLL